MTNRKCVEEVDKVYNTMDAKKWTFVASYNERLLGVELSPETSQKVDACINAIIAGIWKELNQ